MITPSDRIIDIYRSGKPVAIPFGGFYRPMERVSIDVSLLQEEGRKKIGFLWGRGGCSPKLMRNPSVILAPENVHIAHLPPYIVEVFTKSVTDGEDSERYHIDGASIGRGDIVGSSNFLRGLDVLFLPEHLRDKDGFNLELDYDDIENRLKPEISSMRF